MVEGNSSTTAGHTPTMPFGRFKGQPLTRLPERHVQWLASRLAQGKLRDPALRHALADEIARRQRARVPVEEKAARAILLAASTAAQREPQHATPSPRSVRAVARALRALTATSRRTA